MCSAVVNKAMVLDWISDAAIPVAQLLDNGYKVYIYNGDKDYACNWEGGYNWVQKMKWTGYDGFNRQSLQKCVYGECQEYKNLKFIKVTESGHMVPMDQPVKAIKMFNEFIGLT